MRDFKQLGVWQKAHELALAIYKDTIHFPDTEKYGLTSQMRRAAVSIPSNIAEGCGRDGDAELKRFFLIAMGSASELQYQILLAYDLGFIPQARFATLDAQVLEVKKMLSNFIVRLKSNT